MPFYVVEYTPLYRFVCKGLPVSWNEKILGIGNLYTFYPKTVEETERRV